MEKTPWWLLRLPNTEDNVESSIDKIVAFAYSVKGKRVPSEDYAFMSMEKLEYERIRFFEKILEKR